MKKIILASVSLFVVLTIAAIAYLYVNLSPVSPQANFQAFVINQGEGLSLIGSRLKKAGIIKDENVFILYSYYMGLNTKLQAGSFQLSPAMTVEQVIQKLSTGGSHDYWLKILPGQRIEEVAAKFAVDGSTIDPNQFAYLAKDFEGKLYPDSYLIPEKYSAQEIIDYISGNFSTKTQSLFATHTSKLSNEELIILASVLEREARTLESKKMVAGILLNRLEIGMPLQVDATVQYAKDTFGYKKLGGKWTSYDFWQPVGTNDLQIQSDFNTYTNPGLPPYAICNPSLDSLTAAANPTDSDYLFYITGNDNQMHYAKTLDEHNLNIQKYLR